MAAKLTVLRTDTDSQGVKRHRILFYYAISPAIVDFNAAPVIVQTRAELPSEVGSYLVEADKAAIDAGTAGFEQCFREQTNGETNAAFATRMLADHTALQTAWVAAKRAQFAQAGRGVS